MAGGTPSHHPVFFHNFCIENHGHLWSLGDPIDHHPPEKCGSRRQWMTGSLKSDQLSVGRMTWHVDNQVFILSILFWLVVSNMFKHVLFSIIYGMSSFPLTNSYFSRWLLHHQPVLQYPLVNVYSLLGKWPIKIDGLPIKNGDVLVRYVKLPEGSTYSTLDTYYHTTIHHLSTIQLASILLASIGIYWLVSRPHAKKLGWLLIIFRNGVRENLGSKAKPIWGCKNVFFLLICFGINPCSFLSTADYNVKPGWINRD